MTDLAPSSIEKAVPARHHTTGPLLDVRGLRVAFGKGRARHTVVDGIDITVRSGESVAIVGESGSGKSVVARSLIGLVGAGSTVSAERAVFDDVDLLTARERTWRSIRGRKIGFVLQDALSSLDPLRPAGKEIEEALRIHDFGDATARRARVREVMIDVGIPEPDVRALQRSGELSGGLRQRVLIASALALDPPLIIADEPTTALDTTVQAQVIALLNVAKDRRKSLLLISHDLAVVGQLADRILVVKSGVVVESGTAEDILGNPQEDYTKELLSAQPSIETKGTRLFMRSTTTPRTSVAEPPVHRHDVEPILTVRTVSATFPLPGGGSKAAVTDVSLELFPGSTLGVVGESGSGKTTLSRIALALIEPDRGDVLLDGRPWSGESERARRSRRKAISVVYQDPLGSFDPRWNVGDILHDALSPAELHDKSVRRSRVHELLEQVGLPASAENRRPLLMSGGQRQRVAIARAIASRPEIIVLDEPVSALDISIQAQILDLFVDLQQQLDLSYLFISHDLGVIGHMSDRVIVMKDGRVVESGTTQDIFERPTHHYTQELLSAVPSVRAAVSRSGAGSSHAPQHENAREHDQH